MPLLLAWRGPQAPGRVGKVRVPLLDLRTAKIFHGDRTKGRPDMRADRRFELRYGFAGPALIVGNIVVKRLVDRVGAGEGFVAVPPGERREPGAGGFLCLAERQDMQTIRIRHVIGGAERAEPAAGIGRVVPRNPCPALGAAAIPDRQPIGDRAPVGLSARDEAQPPRPGIELRVS